MPDIKPTPSQERLLHLDALRGVALLGVLLVNLLTFFRVSLFTQIVLGHTHPGRANALVDEGVAVLLEFKAFTLFSLLFGVGMGIQVDRLPCRFLLRRFLVLLGIGFCHLVLVSNVDILCLYALCGLLLLPLIKLPTWGLACLGVLALGVSLLPFWGSTIPGIDALRAQGELATRVYATGSYTKLIEFRWAETTHFIFPLLLSVFPRTLGLTLLGMALWQTGLLADPQRHRRLFLWITIGAGLVGSGATILQRSHLSALPLALAYGAALLLWLSAPHAGFLLRPLAALGRLSLSNYLAQSLVFSLSFYGFGLGYFGRFGSATALWIGLVLYVLQLATSVLWLKHFRFGPMEWVWRALTYDSTRVLK